MVVMFAAAAADLASGAAREMEKENNEEKNHADVHRFGLCELGRGAGHSFRWSCPSGRSRQRGTKFNFRLSGDTSGQHGDPTGQHRDSSCYSGNSASGNSDAAGGSTECTRLRTSAGDSAPKYQSEQS